MSNITVPTPEKPTQTTLDEAFERTKQEVSGEITYGFTNDYMFRAVFQKNPKALKGLLGAIFNLKPEDILSCEITNPIILGESPDNKTCILDIRVCLNGNRKVNLEMQMGNLGNWPKRSVYYLCSMFVDLKKGQNYNCTLPCVHVGFVNESPFPDYHNFVSRYLLMNPENNHIYSRDISLIMVDLSQTDNVNLDATEDKTNNKNETDKSELCQWAKMFNAHDWKEVVDLAEKSDSMKEAVVTLHELSEEEKIKLQCLGRILYNGDMSGARSQGIQIGLQQGQQLINLLNQKLIKDNRLNDLQQAAVDSEYQHKLMIEYNILPKEN